MQYTNRDNPNGKRGIGYYWLHAKPGESGQGSNLFFEGDVIYSYGYHFPIARKVDGSDMRILFTTRGYSPTTGKQMGQVMSGLNYRDWGLWHVDNVMADTVKEHVENHDALYMSIKAEELMFARTRSRHRFIAECVEHSCKHMNSYAEEFDLPVPRDVCVAEILGNDFEVEIHRVEWSKEEWDKFYLPKPAPIIRPRAVTVREVTL